MLCLLLKEQYLEIFIQLQFQSLCAATTIKNAHKVLKGLTKAKTSQTSEHSYSTPSLICSPVKMRL